MSSVVVISQNRPRRTFDLVPYCPLLPVLCPSDTPVLCPPDTPVLCLPDTPVLCTLPADIPILYTPKFVRAQDSSVIRDCQLYRQVLFDNADNKRLECLSLAIALDQSQVLA